MEVDAEENSNDNSMDSDESDVDEDLIEAEVDRLEKELSENIFQYQLHLDLINNLKKLVDLDRLRSARKRMSEQFPLAPNLWMDWLQDEQKIATSTEEKEKIVELFEKAVKDYLSVEIWLEYVQFSIGLYMTDFEKIRNVFERSLTAAGLHVPKGSLLWETYIEFEVTYLSMISKETEEYENQLKKIANLFKRQLSCPLFGIDETYERFNMWLEDNVGTASKSIIDKSMVENIYKKSKEKLLKIEQFENNLISESDNLLQYYKEYLEHEKSKEGSPVRVQVLYERLVCDLCLNEECWTEYIDYVSTVLRNGEVAIEICKRAIRNCPWSCAIYQSYIRNLEKFEHPHKEINEAVEQAVSSGLQVPQDFKNIWMTYLEYLRRWFDNPDLSKEEEKKRRDDLIAAFSRASEYLSQLEDADPDFSITQFWARIEAIYFKNLEKSRSLWSGIVSVERNKTAEMWLEYINLEKAYGDSKHLRKLYPRALLNTKDWPEYVAKAWINYERDEGTLESYENCLSKVKARMKQVKEQREKEEAKKAEIYREQNDAKFAARRAKKAGLGYKEKNTKTEDVPENKPKQITGYKRKQTSENEGSEVSPSKKTKQEEALTSEDIVNKLLQEKEQAHGVSVKHDPSKDDRTVFVSNLDFSTEEGIIRDTFSSCGTITDLRLVKDFKGRSKGFCYVEFEKQKEAAAALKKDRELLEGRPMFVSKCDPDKETRTTGFKYKTGLEKNKLFVRGLPFTTTVEDLKELFGKHGALKDVRLVTFRNGHSKGLAFVDFEDEVSAAQAILKTDGTLVGDKEISVAISNPPERKQETSLLKSVQSLGGGPKDAGPRGRGRTQISFVPRSLQVQTAATNSMANLSIASPAPNGNEQKKLNNDDFKKLLS